MLGLADGAVRWDREVHAGGVLALAWQPGGARLATVGQDGRARLWGPDGAAQAELAGDAAWVEQVAWSPDGELLAFASGRFVHVVRASGAPLVRLGPHPSTVTGLAWNRRGERVAASHYGGVSIWTARTGGAVRTLTWKGSMISLAWSPDGQASGNASGRATRRRRIPPPGSPCIRLSPWSVHSGPRGRENAPPQRAGALAAHPSQPANPVRVAVMNGPKLFHT